MDATTTIVKSLNDVITSVQEAAKRYIQLGSTKRTSSYQMKKIRLFNIFCFVWYLLGILMIVEDYVKIGHLTFKTVAAAIPMIGVLAGIQYAHYLRYRLAAYVSFVILIVALTFYFTNVVYRGELLEYFYLLAPPMALIFIDKNWINYTILIATYCCFTLPNFYFEHYPISIFNDMSVSFIFFSVFIMVNYFKQVNLAHEEALSTKTKELEQLNQYKTDFYTNISHEFRTPLTVILGNTELVEGHPREKAAIQNNAHRLLHLVNQLLELGSKAYVSNEKKLVQTNIISHLTYTVESLRSFAEQRKIRVLIDHTHPTVLMDYDKHMLESIMTNLVSNAIKFTNAGGAVHVTTTRDGDSMNIDVADTGIGITDANVQKIFDRFFTTHNDTTDHNPTGMGVGLSIVKDCVTKLGGSIKVSSNLPHGSIFSISLPITNDAPLEDYASANTMAAFLQRNNDIALDGAPMVLIVEDNLDVSDYLSKCLRNQYRIALAYDGDEGLDKAVSQCPDVIISDVMMPKTDGVTLVRKLKSHDATSHIPVILLTAKSSQDDINTGLRAGAHSYIKKPFNKEELLQRMYNILEERKQLQARYSQGISPEEQITEVPMDPWLQKLHDTVVNYSDGNPSVQEMARIFEMSRSQIHRKVKALTGITASEYIKNISCEKMKKALLAAETIKEASESLGYNTHSQFTNDFKRALGMTPSEWIASQRVSVG